MNAKTQEITKGQFVHSVYFWLKNPDNKEDRKKFENSLLFFLDHSKFVLSKYIGTPANTNRPVVDNSYTYCIVVTFASKETHDLYQKEDVHLQFINDCNDLWTKVLVYDSDRIY